MIASLRRKVAQLAIGSTLLLPVILAAADAPNLTSQISAIIEFPASTSPVNGVELRHRASVASIYRERNFQPLWIVDNKFSSTASALLQKLERSYMEGMSPPEYMTSALQKWSKSPRQHDQLQAELVLTDSLIEFFHDIALGTTSAPGKRQGWHFPAAQIDVDRLSAPFFKGTLTFRQTLERLRPINSQYHQLQAVLTRYHQIEARGGWAQVGPGPALRRGDHNARVATLKQRLHAAGDLKNSRFDPEFDSITASALMSFQRRHGLEADGILGNDTKKALNLSVQDRIAQIELSLERWRWLPRELGDRHIMVNVAGSELQLNIDNEPSLDMRVVVGKPKHKTPLFSDQMEYLVFNPPWHVPSSIATKLLYKEKDNPGYLAARQYNAVQRDTKQRTPINAFSDYELEPSEFLSGYRLQQAPGARNTLGKVKFMFPNRFSVYLHDTQEKNLFSRNQRAFSHGCVRVEEPDILARALLQADGLSEGQIDSYLSGGKTRNFVLVEPVPVHLTYQTAWVDRFGKLQFRSDIYKRDKRVLNKIAKTRKQHAARQQRLINRATSLTLASND